MQMASEQKNCAVFCVSLALLAGSGNAGCNGGKNGGLIVVREDDVRLIYSYLGTREFFVAFHC